MAQNTRHNLTWKEVVARNKAPIEKICTDDEIAYHLVYVTCAHLYKKIMWSVFEYEAEFNELPMSCDFTLKKTINDCLCSYNLNTFDYPTSLFDKIKTMPIRSFVNRYNDNLTIPNTLIENGEISEIGYKLGKTIDRKLIALNQFKDEVPLSGNFPIWKNTFI